MFNPKKRGREDEGDDLHKYAPDTKVSLAGPLLLTRTQLLTGPTEINLTLPYLTQHQTYPPPFSVPKPTFTALHTNHHSCRFFRGRELATLSIYKHCIRTASSHF